MADLAGEKQSGAHYGIPGDFQLGAEPQGGYTGLVTSGCHDVLPRLPQLQASLPGNSRSSLPTVPRITQRLDRSRPSCKENLALRWETTWKQAEIRDLDVGQAHSGWNFAYRPRNPGHLRPPAKACTGMGVWGTDGDEEYRMSNKEF